MSRWLVASMACALALCAQAAAAGTIPTAVQARIHAVLSPYDYFPASLPKGLVYDSWKQTHLAPAACGTNVTMEFAGAGGRQVDWSSSRDCDSKGNVKCSADGYPGYAYDISYDARRATIDGRQAFFSEGNYGSNAWACIPVRTGRAADWAVVGIWESGSMSPADAMQLVAAATH